MLLRWAEFVFFSVSLCLRRLQLTAARELHLHDIWTKDNQLDELRLQLEEAKQRADTLEGSLAELSQQSKANASAAVAFKELESQHQALRENISESAATALELSNSNSILQKEKLGLEESLRSKEAECERLVAAAEVSGLGLKLFVFSTDTFHQENLKHSEAIKSAEATELEEARAEIARLRTAADNERLILQADITSLQEQLSAAKTQQILVEDEPHIEPVSTTPLSGPDAPPVPIAGVLTEVSRDAALSE